MSPDSFPFKSELSLAPLIAFWTKNSAYDEFGRGRSRIVREKVEQAPELTARSTDWRSSSAKALVDAHGRHVPAGLLGPGVRAACSVQLRAFYATPPFRSSLMPRTARSRAG